MRWSLIQTQPHGLVQLWHLWQCTPVGQPVKVANSDQQQRPHSVLWNETSNTTYCDMCFLVLGDHKVNLSLIHSLLQVVESGTISYVVFSQHQSLHQCDQRKVVKLYGPVSTQATKLSSFQDLKAVWKISLGAPC